MYLAFVYLCWSQFFCRFIDSGFMKTSCYEHIKNYFELVKKNVKIRNFKRLNCLKYLTCNGNIVVVNFPKVLLSDYMDVFQFLIHIDIFALYKFHKADESFQCIWKSLVWFHLELHGIWNKSIQKWVNSIFLFSWQNQVSNQLPFLLKIKIK